MAWSASMDRLTWRGCLTVTSDPMPDALLRVLGAVVVQSIRLVSARHEASDDEATTRLEILAPSSERAGLLAARLAQAPCIRGVVLLEG
jgi:hypothetical protein